MNNSRVFLIGVLSFFSPCSWAEFEVSPEIISKGKYAELLDGKRTDDDCAKHDEKTVPFHERQYSSPKYNQHEIDAVKQLKREALAGDVHAQCTMAEYYHKGYIVNKSYEKAEELYRKAMAQGHADAYYRLGILYCFFYDNTYKRSEDKKYVAIRIGLFRQGVQLGHLGAKYEMAMAYGDGLGVKKNASLAVKLCRQIVDAKGHEPGYDISTIAKAQNLLGTCYEYGRGVKQSAKTAAYWYRLAALQLNAAALKNYSRLLATGKGVKKDPKMAEYCDRLSYDGWQEEALFDQLNVIPYIYRIQSTRDNKRLPLIERSSYPESKPLEIPAPIELMMG